MGGPGARGYPRLENGSSTYGTKDLDPETKRVVMYLRGNWQFYAALSFFNTFRPLLRFPLCTGDEFGACHARARALCAGKTPLGIHTSRTLSETPGRDRASRVLRALVKS